jgi:hypothetical protein
MGRVMILITPEKQDEIAAAIERARANTIPWEKIRDHAVNDHKPTLRLADRRDPHWRPPSERICFDGGVEAAISFEEQPAGIMRHLSVSAPNSSRVLDPTTFALVAKEFGIELDLRIRDGGDPFGGKPGRFWTEEFAPGEYAINVIVLEVERQIGNA